MELSSLYAQFSAISEQLMLVWVVTHTMGLGDLMFSGDFDAQPDYIIKTGPKSLSELMID